MSFNWLRARASGLCVAILVAGCDPALTGSGDSVSDVLLGERPGDSPFGDSLVRARIRNESSLAADVDLRFVRGNQQVHSAFVHVLPNTITTVATPRLPEALELSGEDEMGGLLTEELFIFGEDFDEDRPAEYWIRDAGTEPQPDRPTPGTPSTRLNLLEPAADLTRTVGETIVVAWEDESIDADAKIAVFAIPQGRSPRDAIELRSDVPVAGDGLGDQTEIILPSLRTGVYVLAARIDDGDSSQWATAPGLLNILQPIGNIAPALTILSPNEPLALRAGETLDLKWTDSDPDDNAVLEFRLDPSAAASATESFPITAQLSENPDGAADTERVRIELLPGTYDLVGLISDGRLSASVRLPRWIVILPAPQNDPPQLIVHEPADDQMLDIGSTLRVRWTDADADHNALITLLLDPDLMNVPLNGNEIILASAIGEDADEAADVREFSIPAGTPSGVYRLLGVIRDGLTEVVAAAPGVVYVSRPPVDPGDGGGGPGGGGGGPGDGDPGDPPGNEDPPDGNGNGGSGGTSGGGTQGDPTDEGTDLPAPTNPR